MTAPAVPGAPSATWLIESKLASPRLHHEVLGRPRLLGRLDRSSAAALTLVVAPAGYGKTVTVASWLEERDIPAAWVSVDRADNDPVRLWEYIATGVARACDGVGALALERLHTLAAAVEPAIDELATRLAADGRRVAIVLDDLHLIDEQRCLRSLDYATRALPHNVDLIAIARAAPRLRLARMRSQGALLEVRTRDLAFTRAEARRLLVRDEGIELSDADVRELTRSTEGWPAALHLAALWLREVDDWHRALREFGGHHHHISEYLTQEVLDGLDPATRRFLVRSSVLARLRADLCDDVLETSGSAAMLERIERANLFLVSLDRRAGWFRYHALFAELLQRKLETSEPGAAHTLHRRAAAWFREHGLIEEAAEHAHGCGDHELIGELLEDHHLAMAREGRAATVVRWLGWLPDETLRARPGVVVAGMLATGAIGRPHLEVRRLVALAQRAGRDHPEQWLPYHEASVQLAAAVYMEDDVEAAVRAAKRAVAASRGGAEEMSVVTLSSLARVQLLAGRDEHAERAARRAVRHPEALLRPFGYVTAVAVLALVAARQGRLTTARSEIDRALAAASDAGIRDSPAGGTAVLADATVARLEGRLAQAQRAAERALRLRGPLDGEVLQAWTRLTLAHVCAARGRVQRAADLLTQARDLLAGCRDPGGLPVLADEVAAALDAARADGARPPTEAPSDAELAVLRMLPTDRPLREIAGELYLSVNTVKSHSRELYRKLGVHSRADAVERAAAIGLLESPG